MNTACRLACHALMTRRAALNGLSSGPPSAIGKCGRPCRAERKRGSARADDRDHIAVIVIATVRAATRSATRNVAVIDFVEGRGLRKSLRLAVGIGGGRAALFPGSEAAVDAVAVGVVGDDEHAPLGLCNAGEADQSDETDQ